ncbi:MAG: DUF1674 domain-containing protein [Alphaproteobacteria bacterium]|nr:DUF1674 domain-containing protein [Alphaproteobacteria bacterium]
MTADKKNPDVGKPVEETAESPIPSKEHGGQEGPDPTRFGDWEKGGRCVDF